MDMYKLKQIPSETQVRKYLRRAIFGSGKLFWRGYLQERPESLAGYPQP